MKKNFSAIFFAAIFSAFSLNAKTASEIIREMGAGWNLGNTLDACDDASGKLLGLETETSWGMPKTVPAIFDAVKAAGFQTVRIPVSWHNHLSAEKIDSAWMTRVKEVVDMALQCGLYVVINIHHDTWDAKGDFWGYYPDAAHKEKSVAYVKNIWQQVAAFFASYDERLVFETLNEPRLRNTSHEWWCGDYLQKNNCPSCKSAVEIINELNQVAMDAIRSSGKNNASRLVIFPSYVASPDYAFKDDISIPKDSAKMTALSVHMYTPYNFAMESPGSKIFTDQHKNDLNYYFETLNKKFCKNGMPVFVGEFGATNKNNAKERIKWARFFASLAKKNAMSYCLWDNGQYKVSGSNYEEHFGYLERTAGKWFDADFVAALISPDAKPEKPAKEKAKKK